jgi:predicted phosphohydrolase
MLGLVRLVVLSYTHGRHAELDVPEGDVLVHCGDLSGRGRLAEIAAFDAWLAELPHPHKLVIAGNHDWAFQTQPEAARAALRHAHYLQDSGLTIDGVSFWGSPWQPWFLDWAFNLPRGPALAERWAQIPPGTDVVITHGPPMGHVDQTARGESVGCEALTEALERLQPRLHLCGHIHEAAGESRLGRTRVINASNLDLRYAPAGAPVVIDLDPC